MRSKLITARKTVKTDKFSHHSYLTPNRSDTVRLLTCGAYRGFAAIRDQWRHIIFAQIKKKQEPK